MSILVFWILPALAPRVVLPLLRFHCTKIFYPFSYPLFSSARTLQWLLNPVYAPTGPFHSSLRSSPCRKFAHGFLSLAVHIFPFCPKQGPLLHNCEGWRVAGRLNLDPIAREEVFRLFLEQGWGFLFYWLPLENLLASLRRLYGAIQVEVSERHL